MSKNIIVSRKAAIVIVSISLFLIGFNILDVNIPDDIDITSGISSAVASMDTAPTTPAQQGQVVMPPTMQQQPPTPELPPIDLIALRIKRTEELARLDYERMRRTQKYIQSTPKLPKPRLQVVTRTFQTTCYDPNYGYYHCTVTQ